MYVLNVNKAIQGVQEAEAHSKNAMNIDSALDKRKFRLFMRIMKAKSPSDISDIPTEEIFSLFEDIGAYASYFTSMPDVIQDMGTRMAKVKGVMTNRRIL